MASRTRKPADTKAADTKAVSGAKAAAAPSRRTCADAHARHGRRAACLAARGAARDRHLPGDDRAAAGRPRQVGEGPRSRPWRRIRSSRWSPSGRPSARISSPSTSCTGSARWPRSPRSCRPRTAPCEPSSRASSASACWASSPPRGTSRLASRWWRTRRPPTSRSRRWCGRCRARSSTTCSRAPRCHRRRPWRRATSRSQACWRTWSPTART